MNNLNALLRSLALLFCMVSAGSLFAQSTDVMVNHELGLRMFGIGDFDLIYKKQLEASKFYRYRLGFANFNYTKIDRNRTADFNAGFAAGPERRREVAEKLKFIHGWELLGNFGISSQKNNSQHIEQISLSAGVGIVLGFQYDVSEKFHISLEAIPAARASYTLVSDPSPDRFQVNGGFDTDAVGVSLVYCFSTEKKEGK